MKTQLLFLLFLILFKNSLSQNVFFEWAKQLDRRTGLSGEEGYFIGADAQGNVYVAGNFRGNMDIDPGQDQFNITSEWDYIFVIKLDPLGNFIWGKQIGGTRFTLCKNIAVDLNGNVYLTGSFSGTTDFDPGTGIYNLTATPTLGTENYDAFTCKLDSDGNFQWANHAGNLGYDVGISIAVDPSGNVYTTGIFSGRADFDPGNGLAMLGTNGIVNAFVTKFDNAGNLVWAKDFQDQSYGYTKCIRTDNSGNVYVSGAVSSYSGPAFLAKLTSAGSLVWLKSGIGGGTFQVDANQAIVIYQGAVNFFSYLSKYDVNGDLLWSKTTGGRPPSGYYGNGALQLDAAGNIFLAGEFNYTTDFDPGPGIYNMTAFGNGYNYDAFICRLDGNGNFIWAKQFGGPGEDRVFSLIVHSSGDIFSTGTYWSTVDFDPDAGIYNLSAYPGGGIFIQKLSRCLNRTYSTLNIASCNNYTLNNILYTQSGTYTQTFRNQFDCDSIVTLNLTIKKTSSTFSVNACDSYNWNYKVLQNSGIYLDTFINASGCDSIVQLHLTIKNKSFSTVNISICEGDQYASHSVAGTFIDTFIAVNGCDSVRTLHLFIKEKKSVTVVQRICAGQTYAGYSASGTYIDQFNSQHGCDSTRILNLMVFPKYVNTLNKIICKDDNYLGHSTSGTYIDTMQSVNGCDSIQTTHLLVQDLPTVFLGNDTSICIGDSIKLTAGAAQSYLWQDGSTKNNFTVKTPGVYKVTAFNNCGNVSDTITITTKECTVYFPTAFTPNNDGKNDLFGILNPFNISEYHLEIYNRWGQIVFESKNPSIKWDGKLKGAITPGVYVWRCSFREKNIQRNVKGTVTLIK